jgi:hypothetical protein
LRKERVPRAYAVLAAGVERDSNAAKNSFGAGSPSRRV